MPRRAAWLTPNSTTEGEACYQISLPLAVDWFADFVGAFYLLTLPENWEQEGDMTPEDMAAYWADLLDDFVNPPSGPTPC